MEYEQNDLDNAALCVWKEARGEQDAGMQAVAHVIFNRIGFVGFPHTLHDVVYQKNAFTSMSVASDPEYSLMPHPNDEEYAYASAIVSAVAEGIDHDPTRGAHYYANLKNVSSGWFERVISGADGKGAPGHPLTVTIGRQSFYI